MKYDTALLFGKLTRHFLRFCLLWWWEEQSWNQFKTGLATKYFNLPKMNWQLHLIWKFRSDENVIVQLWRVSIFQHHQNIQVLPWNDSQFFIFTVRKKHIVLIGGFFKTPCIIFLGGFVHKCYSIKPEGQSWSLRAWSVI